jgi:hypothetical protein
MHACVGVCVCVCVCVCACTRRMLSVIAARQCMRVWECSSGLDKAHGHSHCCEAVLVLCVLVNARMVTVTAAMR